MYSVICKYSVCIFLYLSLHILVYFYISCYLQKFKSVFFFTVINKNIFHRYNVKIPVIFLKKNDSDAFFDIVTLPQKIDDENYANEEL
jgi:serine protease inhibitor ecotin